MTTEQFLKIKTPKYAIFVKIILIIAAILSLTTIPSVGVIGIFLFVLFGVATFFSFRYFNAEFEYSFALGELSVAKIFAKSSRKNYGDFDLSKAELIAYEKSQDALRLEHKKLRTRDFTSGNSRENIVVVYTYNENNEMERLYIEPNENLLEAIKDAVPVSAYKIK